MGIHPFIIKYDIKFNIYTKDKYYKGREWITLKDKNNIEGINLWYKQGIRQRFTGHNTASEKDNIKRNNFKSKPPNIINNKISKSKIKNTSKDNGMEYKRNYFFRINV